jgi:DNA-binding NarL/FixJ family response regulator
VPLVIFSESESREEIISALNVGAQGLLYAGMNSELALQAFSFILNGGSYFSSALRPRRPYPQRHPAIDCDPKFHVRQIMRKFGVTNRTQVAVVCGAGGEVAPAPASPG